MYKVTISLIPKHLYTHTQCHETTLPLNANAALTWLNKQYGDKRETCQTFNTERQIVYKCVTAPLHCIASVPSLYFLHATVKKQYQPCLPSQMTRVLADSTV